MSAAAIPSTREPERTSWSSFAPTEGWLTLLAVAMMALAVAWSIDDAAWIRGEKRLTDFLVPAALLGVAVGFVGPKVGWGRWRTLFVGVGLAALILPIIVGTVLLGHAVSVTSPVAFLTTVADSFRATATSSVRAWIDLAVERRPLTPQIGHYLLVLGIVAWGTGQYVAFAVFGHRRPLDAAVVLGLLLVVNMALTDHDQLQVLVLYTIAALVLLMRSHVLEERSTWARRRIGDPSTVGELYLRGGSIFAAIAVIGAITLTSTAASAPLQGLWSDMPQRLVQVGQALQRYLPTGGDTRSVGAVGFGPVAAITGTWSTGTGVAFTAIVPAGSADLGYWAVAAYDRFDVNSWSWGETHDVAGPAGSQLLAGQADDPTGIGARSVVRVTIRGFSSRLVVAPSTLISVDRPTTTHLVGARTAAGYFAGTELTADAGSYAVTSSIPVVDPAVPGALTANVLRAAGRDYPAEIRALYLGTGNAMGPHATALLATVEKLAGTSNPYDLAATMVQYLHDPANFTYTTDVSALDDHTLSTVEFFASVRRGYCMYYASTMAILLRQAGIPTRLVQGYLPGPVVNGIETVSNAGAHAWVQVYFPGHGWVSFDPTGGGVSQDQPLPSGPPVIPTPAASGGSGAGATPRSSTNIHEPNDGGITGGGTPATPHPTSSGPFILAAVLLAAAVLTLVAAAWLRGPRREIGPDAAWRTVADLARRFGFGPRPAQTVLEYAGVLGELLPEVRPELQTVATAKVEVAYGRRSLGDDRLRAIASAHRRLRLNLFRLALRRSRRRGR